MHILFRRMAPSAPRRPRRNRAAAGVSRICATFLPVVVVGAAGLGLQPVGHAADGPTLLKRTMMVKLHRFSRYWPNPKAKEPQYNTYCWVPGVQFEILGPVPGGSQFIAEFSKPDGSPWMTVNLPTEEVADDVSSLIKMPSMDEDVAEKQAITATGTFPFKIRLKNELAGKDEVFFSGKYEVIKYPLPRPADDKNKMDFATVEDWRVPIGFLWLNPKLDENVPALATQMWFRGTGDGEPMQAVLFHDGKQVADAPGNNEETLATPSSDDIFNWELWSFTFAKVRGFNKDTSANSWDGVFFLDKNPGNYEIKVLRHDKLVRSAKFTVGADGKIVDNGIATQNKLGGIRMVLPLAVTGNSDGKLNANSWKTQALYGNPLAGFTAAP